MNVFIKSEGQHSYRIGWACDDEEWTIDMTQEELQHLKTLLNKGDV